MRRSLEHILRTEDGNNTKVRITELQKKYIKQKFLNCSNSCTWPVLYPEDYITMKEGALENGKDILHCLKSL